MKSIDTGRAAPKPLLGALRFASRRGALGPRPSLPRVLHLAALALVLAGACGGKDKDVTTGGNGAIQVDESLPDEEKLVILVEGLASNVTAAGTDCDRLAMAITGWVDTYSTRVAQLTQRVETENTGTSGVRVDELEGRLGTAFDSVFSNAKPCDDKARPALNRLDAMFGL